MSDPNESRPGYKETKAGWIPDEWEAVRIGEVSTKFQAGVSVNSEDRPARDGGIGVLKTSCVSTGQFRPLENKAVVPEELDRVAVPVRAGSVIISRMNTVALVGANAFVPEDCPTLFLPDRLWQTSVADADSDNPRWFGYAMASPSTRYHISALATGTSGSMKNVTQDDVRSVFLARPTPQEQPRIADILSTCDEAIEKTGDLIKAKQRQKKALMQQLLTGKKRLPGFEGEWKEARLGDLFIERAETNREDLPLLAITGTRGIIPAADIDRKDSSSADKSRYKVIQPGDIGYNTMRMWQGVSAVSSLQGIVSPAYTICVPNDSVDVRFMGYFFKFPPVVYLFWRYSQGLVDDTLNLKFPNFAVIHVTVPDLAEQKAIAKVLHAADEEIAALDRKKSVLQQQKKALMQKLLTGQVRVKV